MFRRRRPLLKPSIAQGSTFANGAAPMDELYPLVLASRSGDSAATNTLLLSVGPSVVSIIRGILGKDWERWGSKSCELQDAVQEALHGFVVALPRFRGDCTVRHFACRVAVLTSLKLRRSTASFRCTDHEGNLENESSLDETPLEAAEANVRRKMLQQLLGTLPEAQAEALALHCVCGFSIQELAATAGCSLETARSRLRLAKQALRRRIESSSSMKDMLCNL